MTEFSPRSGVAPDSGSFSAERKVGQGRGKRAALAGLFSLVVAGMGQLYNRQPRKALLLALAIPILTLVTLETRILFTFSGMIRAFAIVLGWRLFIAIEAAYAAWKNPKPEGWVARPRVVYPLVGAVLVLAVLYPSADQFKRWSGFGAFRDPSRSMCPTICLGERFVADMNAYQAKSPERGDIVLLENKPSAALFMKRVIGLPGDFVAPGENGTVLVNGKPLVLPSVCGNPIQVKVDPADYSAFEAIKVPEHTFFVVGDNLGDSFDSRIPEFGAVGPDQIRGRPLFLYWSRGRSRIGCRIR